jgi:ABC-2 type transport system ATP-binding protein
VARAIRKQHDFQWLGKTDRTGRIIVAMDMADKPEPETEAAPALVVSNVSHRFGETLALDDVSLTVPRAAFVVLLGLNGAGKSTLFALITRLYDNVTGTILIFGYDVRRRASAALQRLGVVFQTRTLDLDLSVKQNLLYHCALHGIRGRDARARTKRALEMVGLADRAREKVRNLSGGQARRLEIARALLHRPALLLLDEPTVGLDIGSRESVINIVRSLVEKEGLGVLWATHLFDEVRPTDQVVILHKGKVLFAGSVPELLATTATQNVSDAFRKLTGTATTELAA